LEHPGLHLPVDAFTETPYGPPRRYLVEQEISPPPATSLSIPQEFTRVLEWGISLAKTLDYLHRQHVTLRETGLDYLNHVVVTGKRAQWAHLSEAYVVPPTDQGAMAGYFAQDVQGLATGLLYLATGHQRARGVNRALAQLPEQAATALKQALTPRTKLSAEAFATALEASLQELRHPESVTLIVGRRTDVGRARSLNEDSLLTLDVAPVFRSVSAPAGLFAVADGMGGHEAGEVASRMAIQAIAQQATSDVLPAATAGESLPDAHQWLTDAAATANRVVHDQRQVAGTDMGTTLVIALVIGNKATIANVGDSRAYLLGKDEIAQITTDHSLVERLVATGQITPEEAANHPQKNVIYRVIGDKPQVKTDLFEQQLAPDQALLLCSDGLSGMVPDEQIWHIWRTSTSPQDACDRLVEAANQAGGEDNVTTVIVQVKG
jgi:serine/threonine protein phosphatase PrpC